MILPTKCIFFESTPSFINCSEALREVVKNRSVIGLPRHPESLRTDLSYLFMLQKVLGQMTHRYTLANPKNRLDIGRYVPKDQSKVYVASSK